MLPPMEQDVLLEETSAVAGETQYQMREKEKCEARRTTDIFSNW